ncbi:glycosyltransferase [Patescibacteria group bacterium]|nr:glycosyltransferase [Patescibacteria group bacterium]
MHKVDLLFIGGHHTSTIPIIKEFLAKNKKIIFVGHKFATVENTITSSEYKEISSLQIPYFYFKAPKFYAVGGVYKYIFFIKSLLNAFKLLLNNRPRVVISFGGYLAVPVVISARFLNIKVITHEQTATTGLANSVISYFANMVLLTWKTSLPFYKNRKNVFVVGLPLRQEIINTPVKNFSKNYQLKKLFVQGGKQGSHKINEFIFENIDYLCKKYVIFHQTSINSTNKDFEISKQLEKKYKNLYYSFDFLYGHEYSEILKSCDFAFTRSGAHIVYEFSYLKMPSIFIPISWSSKNEQLENALMAQKYTPSVLVEESELTLNSFLESIKNLEEKIVHQENFLQVEKNAITAIVGHIESLL